MRGVAHLSDLSRRVAGCRAELSGWWCAVKIAITPGEEDWSYVFDEEDHVLAAQLIARADKTSRAA